MKLRYQLNPNWLKYGRGISHILQVQEEKDYGSSSEWVNVPYEKHPPIEDLKKEWEKNWETLSPKAPEPFYCRVFDRMFGWIFR